MPRPVPADLEDALAEHEAARERFWALPPEQKDEWVAWVERSRLPGTRRRRLAEAAWRLAGPRARTTLAERPAAAVPFPRDDRWAWLLGLALLAGLAAFLVWLTVYRHHGSGGAGAPAAVVVTAKATVPKVTGIRVQAARFQLREAKLGAKLVRKPAAKPKGIVLRQKPAHGAKVPQGTPVSLVVSSGPPRVALPDVVGLAAADAVKALQARKLSPSLQQVASKQPPGTVLAQKPKAGARAKPGTKVVLQVSKGVVSVAVPDVTGQSQQQAAAALGQAGLRARSVQVPSSQPPGTVVAQHPAAGGKAAKGSVVRLNVAAAGQPATTAPPPTTTSPPATTSSAAPTGNDYTGMRLPAAVQRIAQGRQQVIVAYVASSAPAGVVTANSRAGSRERLEVSAGAQPQPAAQVPDVTGEDAATATRDLQAAGFGVVEAQWPVSDPSQDDVVTAETPAGGGQAPQRSSIVIYVGSANG